MTELKAPGSDIQNEQKWKIPEPKLTRRNTIENHGIVKNVIEQNLANFMQKQAAEKNLFTPSNTQYQRLI